MAVVKLATLAGWLERLSSASVALVALFSRVLPVRSKPAISAASGGSGLSEPPGPLRFSSGVGGLTLR
jgi:hypothetical protein